MKAVISVNAGSSSIKFGLYGIGAAGPVRLIAGKLEGIGTAPHLLARRSDGAVIAERRWPDSAGLTHEDLLGEIHEEVRNHLAGYEIVAVGHRVVHGGTQFAGPVRIDPVVIAALESLCVLAPLHQPHNLAAIRAMSGLAGDVPQIACFDTAFHRTMPEIATRFALPGRYHAAGVRRYGFHGLSYAYVAQQLREIDPVLAEGRVVIAHLGSGASLCALHGGRSVDTSMGFTALDGLMMGTRCGTLDPGVVLHLQRQEGLSATEVETMLYHQSGLLGVSGISSDMRDLHLSEDPRAAEAIELFTWRVAREVGALASSMGGIDGLVFTAGIGENDAIVRAQIAARLAWTGLAIDPRSKAAKARRISAEASAIPAYVIPTDEELMIALESMRVLKHSKGHSI